MLCFYVLESLKFFFYFCKKHMFSYVIFKKIFWKRFFQSHFFHSIKISIFDQSINSSIPYHLITKNSKEPKFHSFIFFHNLLKNLKKLQPFSYAQKKYMFRFKKTFNTKIFSCLPLFFHSLVYQTFFFAFTLSMPKIKTR